MLKNISIIILILTVSIGGYFIYEKSVYSKKLDETQKKTTIAKLKSDPIVAQLINSADKNGGQAVYEQLDKASSQESETNKKQVLMLYAAYALMQSDQIEGAKYYTKIVNNSEFSALNRAYAMIKIRSFAAKDSNPSMVSGLFPNNTLPKVKTNAEIYYLVDKKTYETYPYLISGIRIAEYEYKIKPSTSTAEKVLDKYINNPQNISIEGMLKDEGLRNLIPNTLLAKGKFLSQIEKYGYSNKEDIYNTYNDALKYVDLYGYTDTKGYICLRYANYLLKNNETEKAIFILKKVDFTSDKNLVKYLNNSKTAKADYTYISKSKNKDIIAIFAPFKW